jgi:hypothetical protein
LKRVDLLARFSDLTLQLIAPLLQAIGLGLIVVALATGLVTLLARGVALLGQRLNFVAQRVALLLLRFEIGDLARELFAAGFE